MHDRARVLAFYLPQFHPIPENDAWWGKGFTEWTNVAKAKPLFRGHVQPNTPADLGFYDLRLPEAREAQAELARAYGIEGFCYWHYWFGNGKQLLERPLAEVVASGKPDFPFCLAWANETWTGKWYGAPNRILAEQTYPGEADHVRHFYSLLRAFRDPRYVTVDGLRLFLIYKPAAIPDLKRFIELWNELAAKEGIKGFYFIANDSLIPNVGFNAFIENLPFLNMPRPGLERLKQVIARVTGSKVKSTRPVGDGKQTIQRRLVATDAQEAQGLRKFARQAEDWFHRLVRKPKMYRYHDYLRHVETAPLRAHEHPVLIPNWDNTPRSGYNGVLLKGSTPELFEKLCSHAGKKLQNAPDGERRLVFVKSWNEWAEGNYLEPDLEHGHKYLEALQRGLQLQNPDIDGSFRRQRPAIVCLEQQAIASTIQLEGSSS